MTRGQAVLDRARCFSGVNKFKCLSVLVYYSPHYLTKRRASFTRPAFTGVVPPIVLTDGAIKAGFRVARRERCLTVWAGEGCLRAVTAVTETIT